MPFTGNGQNTPGVVHPDASLPFLSLNIPPSGELDTELLYAESVILLLLQLLRPLSLSCIPTLPCKHLFLLAVHTTLNI